MSTKSNHADIVIAGAGIAGLIAANRAADAGATVLLVDKSEHAGGRARSRIDNEIVFNQGAHALYVRGNLAHTLKELGVTVSGKPGAARGVFIRHRGDYAPMPVNVMRLLTHPWFSLKGRRDLVRFYGRAILGRMNHDLVEREFGVIGDETARLFAQSLVRLSTYCAEPEQLIASEAAEQLRRASGGVLYLDGGWQTIVDGLVRRAKAKGVQILTGAAVESVRALHDEVTLVLSTGVPMTGRTGILAASPAEENAWLGISHSLRPVRAACLDIALTNLPQPDHIFAQDIDQPLYLSVHSASADLGPAQVIHLVRYLKSDEQAGPETAQQLHEFLASFQPGYETRIVQKRFLPNMIVAHDIPGKNTPVRIFPDKPLFRAGDWVEGSGMISDRSASTASSAAAAAVRELAHSAANGSNERARAAG